MSGIGFYRFVFGKISAKPEFRSVKIRNSVTKLELGETKPRKFSTKFEKFFTKLQYFFTKP